MPAGVFTPYSTVESLFSGEPTWIPEEDRDRIRAYETYERMYWGVPDTFKLMARGSENKPIYVPSGKVIVDTTDRFVGNGFGWIVDPSFGDSDAVALARALFRQLFARERFISKFHSNKLYGIMRGDWLWHIVADAKKPAGTRISIHAVDPGSYFPVYADNDLDQLLGIHLVDRYKDEKSGKEVVKKQTYWRDPVTHVVTSEAVVYEPEKWFRGDAKALETLLPPTELPPEITSIPVYAIRNIEQPGNPFGSSELRGIERIQAAVNQAISDEELALALEGLGMYATDGGAPVDEQGKKTDWVLGPGRVVEVKKDSKFERVDGVRSITPSLDHINFLLNALREAAGTPQAATGKVDVKVAESGISLMLQLGPLLAKAEIRDQGIADVHAQMLFDLKAWFKAFEGMDVLGTDIVPVFGPKLPEDQDKRFNQLLQLYTATPPLISAEYFRSELARMGYEFPAEMETQIAKDITVQAAVAQASDPFVARAAKEASLMGEEDTGDRSGEE